MNLLPGPLVDRLPVTLWSTGNLHLRGKPHFCHDIAWVRTVEWDDKIVAVGTRPRSADAEAHGAR